MSLDLPPPTDLEIAAGITAAIADLNRYLNVAVDSGLRVEVNYDMVRELGPRYGRTVYGAEILRPVGCAS